MIIELTIALLAIIARDGYFSMAKDSMLQNTKKTEFSARARRVYIPWVRSTLIG